MCIRDRYLGHGCGGAGGDVDAGADGGDSARAGERACGGGGDEDGAEDGEGGGAAGESERAGR